MERGDRVRVTYEATYDRILDGIHWVTADDGPNDVWTNIIPRSGSVVPAMPPGCQPSDCCACGARRGEAHSETCPFPCFPEAAPLPGATILQSGDRVLLCMASEPDSNTMHAICKQLTERYPNIHFGLVTGVAGVLIDRGNDDSTRKADDT